MSPAQRIRPSMAHPGPACPRTPALTPVPWSHATPFGAWPGRAPDGPWQQDPHTASPFSDLLAETGPSAKGFSLPPACREGGVPTAFVQGPPRSGPAPWLGVTPVHGCAWGLRRGGVSGAEPLLPESLAPAGPPPAAPDRGASPSPALSGRREAAPVTALSALFEVGRLGASFKNVGFLFNFPRKTMV